MEQNSLKEKATFSMLWTTLQRFVSIAISFISGIILARLLSPEDYGTIGLLTIFMVVSEVFIDGGFGSALIQKKEPNDVDYSTIFWWNLFMAIVLYVILYLSAPFIAVFFSNDLLISILRVEALVLIIGAFNTIQVNQLRKNLQFKSLALVSLMASIISLTVTIVLAYNGFGVWSLVAQRITSTLVQTVYYWFKVKWKPSFVFSISSFKQLASFGVFILLTKLVNETSKNFQGLLIGRYFSHSTMGYYSKAKSTENLASTSISSSLNQVTYPLYAKLQDNKGELIRMIKKVLQVISFVTFPLMYLLILDAKEIFTFLYSDKWLGSVVYFQILCFAGAAQCLQGANLQPVNAIGKSKQTFGWNLIKKGVGVCLMLGGFYIYGIKGLLIGMVCNSWMLYFINVYIVAKYIGYKIWDQIKDILPTLILSLISLMIAYMLSLVLPFHMYINGLIKGVVFCSIYLIGVNLFKIEAYATFRSILPMVLSKLKINT